MNKREREAIAKAVLRIGERIAKSRDNLRTDVSELESLLESVASADEAIEGVLYHLRKAADELDCDVADKLSEYV